VAMSQEATHFRTSPWLRRRQPSPKTAQSHPKRHQSHILGIY
jgi:hypothetical protein